MSSHLCTYSTLYRYGLLVVLVLLGVAMGTWQEIISPTLPNLKGKLNVSYESLGRMMSMRSIGDIFSLLMVGYLYDSFPRIVPFMMFALCFLAGVCTIIIPWCSQFWVVTVLFFIQSACQTGINNGGQLTILQTFKEKAIGKMQIYHLGYGTGGILSGLIAGPFLPKNTIRQSKITKFCQRKLESFERSLELSSVDNKTMSSIEQTGSFEYIYMITGILAILVSLIFILFQTLRNPEQPNRDLKKKESLIKKLHPKYTANGKVGYGAAMTILLFLFYFFYIFAVSNFMPFMVVYAIDPCKAYAMPQRAAAYFHSIVNGCFLTGRIFGSFVLDINPSIMIIVFNIFNLIFVFVLTCFSHRYVLALWIGACGMRFCNSIMYPTGTSYVNRYIIVTSCLISIAFLGSSMGEILAQLTGGYVIDNYPSRSILFTTMGSMSLLFIVIVIIVVLGIKNGLREFPNTSLAMENTNKNDNES